MMAKLTDLKIQHHIGRNRIERNSRPRIEIIDKLLGNSCLELVIMLACQPASNPSQPTCSPFVPNEPLRPYHE